MPKPKNGQTVVVASPDNDRRQRRRFSASDKERILLEADACTQRGQLGELLRRKGNQLADLWPTPNPDDTPFINLPAAAPTATEAVNAT